MLAEITGEMARLGLQPEEYLLQKLREHASVLVVVVVALVGDLHYYEMNVVPRLLVLTVGVLATRDGKTPKVWESFLTAVVLLLVDSAIGCKLTLAVLVLVAGMAIAMSVSTLNSRWRLHLDLKEKWMERQARHREALAYRDEYLAPMVHRIWSPTVERHALFPLHIRRCMLAVLSLVTSREDSRRSVLARLPMEVLLCGVCPYVATNTARSYSGATLDTGVALKMPPEYADNDILSMAITPSGNFAIYDLEKYSVLHFNRAGTFLEATTLPHFAHAYFSAVSDGRSNLISTYTWELLVAEPVPTVDLRFAAEDCSKLDEEIKREIRAGPNEYYSLWVGTTLDAAGCVMCVAHRNVNVADADGRWLLTMTVDGPDTAALDASGASDDDPKMDDDELTEADENGDDWRRDEILCATIASDGRVFVLCRKGGALRIHCF